MLGPEDPSVMFAVGKKFAVAVLADASAGAVAAHAEIIRRAARKQAIPVLAVLFMTEAGRRACHAAGVSWLDLSGNAHIVAPGLRVILDGHPNQFVPRGRPASVFAPKSARVVRWLLVHPHEVFTQREIARGTDMSEGFVSRIVTRLQADGFVDRVGAKGDVAGRGPVRVRDAAVVLDAWSDVYDFDKHVILRGHVAARSGDALTRFVAERFEAQKIDHAATGLSAAWQMSRFAAFRLASFFVASEPTPRLLETLGFRDDPRGANLWLVVPNDAGVFLGAATHAGVRCVHPLQAYLDLAAHPERAAEAAERLRSDFSQRSTDA